MKDEHGVAIHADAYDPSGNVTDEHGHSEQMSSYDPGMNEH